jgi:hypothetical protein
MFDSFQGTFEDLLEGYSDEQLATIADFLTRAAQRSQKAIAQLSQEVIGRDGREQMSRLQRIGARRRRWRSSSRRCR